MLLLDFLQARNEQHEKKFYAKRQTNENTKIKISKNNIKKNSYVNIDS